MLSLVDQARDLALWLEGTVEERAKDYAEGHELYFGPDTAGFETAAVRGKTPEERRESTTSIFLEKTLEELVDLDGSEIKGVVDRSEIFKLLEDPIGPQARGPRRYVLFSAALLFLMAPTQQPPQKIPWIDVHLGQHTLMIEGFLILLIAYQGISFYLYARADFAKRSIST